MLRYNYVYYTYVIWIVHLIKVLYFFWLEDIEAMVLDVGWHCAGIWVQTTL